MEIVLGKLPNDDDNNSRARQELRRLEQNRPDVHVREVWCPPIAAEAFGFPIMNANGTRCFGVEDIQDFVEQELIDR